MGGWVLKRAYGGGWRGFSQALEACDTKTVKAEWLKGGGGAGGWGGVVSPSRSKRGKDPALWAGHRTKLRNC